MATPTGETFSSVGVGLSTVTIRTKKHPKKNATRCIVPHEHQVMVGNEAGCIDEATDFAESFLDQGDIWQNMTGVVTAR